MPRLVALAAAWVAVALSVAPASAQTGAAVGQVVSQHGLVTVLRASGPSVLVVGEPLSLADRIVTAPGSRVVIELADGARVTIGAESELALSAVAAPAATGPLRTVLSLALGIVRAVLPTGSRFEVQTSAAIASARSTVFIVEAEPDKAAVLALEGRVDVTAAGAVVTLGPGEGTDIQAGAAPRPVVRWGEPRVARALARTEPP